MEIAFFDTGTGALERLAEGHPLPSCMPLPLGGIASLHLPHVGIVGILAYPRPTHIEVRAHQVGRWTIGVLPMGPHATGLPMTFKLDGVAGPTAPDFTFSLEHHRRSVGEDPMPAIGPGTRVTVVLAAAETGIIRAVRQARLGEATGRALAADLARQAGNAGAFSFEAYHRTTLAALAAIPRVTRERCAAWEDALEVRAAAPGAEG